jgi:hypothetical protein
VEGDGLYFRYTPRSYLHLLVAFFVVLAALFILRALLWCHGLVFRRHGRSGDPQKNFACAQRVESAHGLRPLTRLLAAGAAARANEEALPPSAIRYAQLQQVEERRELLAAMADLDLLPDANGHANGSAHGDVQGVGGAEATGSDEDPREAPPAPPPRKPKRREAGWEPLGPAPRHGDMNAAAAAIGVMNASLSAPMASRKDE